MESNPTIEKIKIIGDSHFDIHFTQDLGELFTALAKAQAIMKKKKKPSCVLDWGIHQVNG